MRKGLIKTDSVSPLRDGCAWFPNTFPSNESFCLRASSIPRTQKSEPRWHAFIVKIPSVAGVRRFLPKIARPRTQRFGSKGFCPGSDENRTWMILDLSLENKMHPLSTWQLFPTAPRTLPIVRLAMVFFCLCLWLLSGVVLSRVHLQIVGFCMCPLNFSAIIMDCQ
jgi:hypothetical protein